MGTPSVVDCEAPFGVGAPSVGDMTEFRAVDVNALRSGRVETFHGTDCSEDTFRQFREWLTPRMPVVFVSDNPASRLPVDQLLLLALFRREPVRAFRTTHRISMQGWLVISAALRSGSVYDEQSMITIPCMTRSGTPRRSFVCWMGNDDRRRRQTERRLPERMWLDVPGDLPLRLCSRIAAHAQALLASLGHARFQENCSFILTTKQTNDAGVDKPMFALIFTDET